MSFLVLRFWNRFVLSAVLIALPALAPRADAVKPGLRTSREFSNRLRAGPGVWNAWRAKHPGLKPDLRGIALTGAKLKGIDLRQADLRGAVFTRCDLRAADFRRANLSGASFRYSLLAGANLEWVSAATTDFRNAGLQKAVLRHGHFKGARFNQAVLYDIDFSGLNLDSADFTGAHFRRARFAGASLNDASFRGIWLTGGDFNGARLMRANFQGARMPAANLSYTDLRNASFAGADLGYALLVRARIQGADFSRARLRAKECDLRRPDDCRAVFTLARADARTKFPPGFDRKRAGIISGADRFAFNCYGAPVAVPPGMVWIAMPAGKGSCRPPEFAHLESGLALLEKAGIKIFSAQVCSFATCAGCGCPSSRNFLALILARDADKARPLGNGWRVPGRRRIMR